MEVGARAMMLALAAMTMLFVQSVGHYLMFLKTFNCLLRHYRWPRIQTEAIYELPGGVELAWLRRIPHIHCHIPRARSKTLSVR